MPLYIRISAADKNMAIVIQSPGLNLELMIVHLRGALGVGSGQEAHGEHGHVQLGRGSDHHGPDVLGFAQPFEVVHDNFSLE